MMDWCVHIDHIVHIDDLFSLFPLFLVMGMFFFNIIQAGEGDCHGRSREMSRNQRGGRAPGESQIILVLKAGRGCLTLSF